MVNLELIWKLDKRNSVNAVCVTRACFTQAQEVQTTIIKEKELGLLKAEINRTGKDQVRSVWTVNSK